MKGTIVILGCLFAAYAAPLFANEVPLILEETIVLPEATPDWDVAPDLNGEYTWVTLEMSGDNIRQRWGNTIDDLSHTYQILRSTAEEQSISQVRLILRNDAYHVWFQHHMNAFPPSRYSDVEAVVLLNLESHYSQALCTWYARVEGDNEEEWYEYYDYRVRLFEPRLVPPDNTQDLPTHYDYIVWSFMWGHGAGSYLVPSSQSNCDSFGFSVGDDFSCTSWADTQLVGTIDQWENDNRWWFSHKVLVEGSSHRRSRDSVAISDNEYYHDFVEVYDVNSDQGVGAILTIRGNLKMQYEGENSFRYAYDGSYSKLLAAQVLPLETSEQLLAIDSSGTCDVINVSDGQIWGQTSRLDSGFSEMKIIGRYHNETRRLVVRYGTELRIYRFGEPIYTNADDARPELPQELTLSAYPNPFNPTTMIAFDLPKAGHASLVIYDLNGRQITTLFDEQMSAGKHEFGFDGATLPSGIYFARLGAGELLRTQKLVLLK